jgi:SpoIID/LytB domain protein
MVEFSEGGILWNGNQYRELTFSPQSPQSSFSLFDVTIGVNFHWERKETQVFSGTLRLVVESDKIVAINELPVESYLASVISSEMKATAGVELLKAHAVISRSWLLAQMQRREESGEKRDGFFSFIKKDDELIRWYDREDHTIFDVCADDHCQRYQGITKQTSKAVEQALKATRGQILCYEDEICDARFSKCCGGVTEEYQYCWEDTPKPYLVSVEDPFCNTNDKEILSQVLNDYDQETNDFYRWTVEYSVDEISNLINEKLKDDFGTITDLIPLERGKSGRIWKLKIVGTKKTFTIGKELEIRRALSESHLYSSAFDVEKTANGFRLHGKGWGHGVGLCQIGAAVMGQQGYTYEQILLHYYRNAEVKKIY